MKEEREKKKGHGLGSRAGVEDDRGVRGERLIVSVEICSSSLGGKLLFALYL